MGGRHGDKREMLLPASYCVWYDDERAKDGGFQTPVEL
jgi:hypothetical protein